MSRCCVALVFFVLSVGCALAEGRVIDVAAGSDVQSEVEKARRMGEKVTLRFAAGTYWLKRPISLIPEDSGLTFEAKGDAKVVFSGGRKVTGWRKDADGVWSARFPEGRSFRQLTVNGVRRPRCRAPNSGEFLAAGEDAPYSGTHTLGARKHPSMRYDPQDLDLSKLSDLSTGELVLYHWWSDSRPTIARVDSVSNVVHFTRPLSKYTGEMKCAGGKKCRYRLENFRELLDAPGEWFSDGRCGQLEYLPCEGEIPGAPDFVAVAATLTNLVMMTADPVRSNRYVEDITFRGIAFADADAGFPRGSMNESQGAIEIGAAILLWGAKRCRFEDCEFANLEGYAVDVAGGSRQISFLGCRFADLGGGAVRVNGCGVREHPRSQTRAIRVHDCEIARYGLDWASACGILVMNASNAMVSHCWIHDGGYTGISLGWVWGYGDSVCRDNLISYNLIENIGRGILNDMGGIYTLGPMPGTVIRNNIVRNIRSWSYGGHAIYNDEGSQGILVENNLLYDAQDVYNIHYSREVVVRNNIIALGRSKLLSGGRMEHHVSAYLHGNIFYFLKGRINGTAWNNPEKYEYRISPPDVKPIVRRDHDMADWNLFWNPNIDRERGEKMFKAAGVNQHSVWADPLFVDPEHGDFRLRDGSPALGIGFQPIDFSAIGLSKK